MNYIEELNFNGITIMTDIEKIEFFKRRLYIRIGYFLHQWQFMEQLCIFSFVARDVIKDKEKSHFYILENDQIKVKNNSRSFGRILKMAKESKILDEASLNSLEEINQYRNYLIHNFFLEQFTKIVENEKNQDELEEVLDKNTKSVIELNRVLSDLLRTTGFIAKKPNTPSIE